MDVTAEELNCFGLTERDVIDFFMNFTAVGLWRLDLDSGHKFCSRSYFRLFGLDYKCGPINMIELSARIHPEDLDHVMESHEAASVQRLSYQKIHRVTADGSNYRYICSIGSFREKPGTSGEIVGFAYEVPPHSCEFRSKAQVPSA
jgi:PAS domain-containing protein